MAFPVFTSSHSTYYSRFRWLFSWMLFFLLISPGNAAWNTEDYRDSHGTRHEPRSSAETRQSRALTTEFITRKDLQEFQKQIDNSWERMGGTDHSTFHDLEFPNELDIVFRIHLGIESNESVLSYGLFDGAIENQELTTIQSIYVNEPFEDALPPNTSSVRKFIDDVTNGTSRPGDMYRWIGGEIWDFNLTKSRVKRLAADCSEATIEYPDGKIENISWFFFISQTYNYYVYIFPSEHGSPLCGTSSGANDTTGDSLFLKDHGGLSQRLVRFGSDHLATNLPGPINVEDMNTGNVPPNLYFVNSTTDRTSVYFRDIQRAASDFYGTQKWTEQRTLWLKAEAEYESALAAYDNFGFLLLSITALVSSTIVAIVTVRRATIGELAVVVVELIVIILFLYVLSHALVVFSRPDDFVVDYEVRQRTFHTFPTSNGNIRVTGFFRKRQALVGKRHVVGGMLVAAEGCAIVAFIIVFANVIRLLWNRRNLKRATSKVWVEQDKENLA